MKVWTLTTGTYEDARIIGAFSSRELAEKAYDQMVKTKHAVDHAPSEQVCFMNVDDPSYQQWIVDEFEIGMTPKGDVGVAHLIVGYK